MSALLTLYVTDKPACRIEFDHPIPPLKPYFYFETTLEEMDTQNPLGCLAVESAFSAYDKETYGINYFCDGMISSWGFDHSGWPTYGKGSVVGCAVDLRRRIAVFTCDGQVLGESPNLLALAAGSCPFD